MGACCSSEKSDDSAIPVVPSGLEQERNDARDKQRKSHEANARERLAACDFDAMPLTDFNGRHIMARVVEVYDGDTITIGFDEMFDLDRKSLSETPNQVPHLVKLRLRMHGYDSPEMHPLKNAPHRELEMRAAQCARDALARLILNGIVCIRLLKNEKFGRLCGSVTVDNGNGSVQINQWMIDQHLGKPFTGRCKKTVWSLHELETIIQKSNNMNGAH